MRCVVKCIGGELATSVGESGAEFLLEKGFKKAACEVGKKAMPIVGLLDQTYSGVQSLRCFFECTSSE